LKEMIPTRRERGVGRKTEKEYEKFRTARAEGNPFNPGQADRRKKWEADASATPQRSDRRRDQRRERAETR
jgi:hypothetical protein